MLKEKYLCKIVSVILYLVIIMALGNQAWAMEKNENKSNKEINNFIASYFDSVDKSLATLSVMPDLSSYYTEGRNSLEYIALDTAIQHRLLQISDLHFSNYKTKISIEKVSYNKDIFDVTVNKNTEMYFNCLNGEPSDIYEQHIMHIKKMDDGSLKIISDKYGDEIRDLLVDYNSILRSSHSTSIKNASKALLQQSRESVAIQKTKLESLKNNIKITEHKDINKNIKALSGLGYHGYNREAARTYAYKYVLSPNTNYVNFESMGGNCTNFTSQCLRAGGISFDQTGNYQWYYYSSSNRAAAWTGANYFRSYYKNNVGSSSIAGLRAFTSNFDSMRLGDLVQLVSGGTASHTMFISSPIYDNWASSDPWKYKYDVAICQNSVNASGRQKNIPLSTKPTNREYIHIEGSYY